LKPLNIFTFDLRSRLGAVVILATAVFFSGCRKDPLTGIEALPEGNALSVFNTDTLSLTTYTVREDSLRSDETPLALLGSMVDPEFGASTAGFITQLRLSAENVVFDNLGTTVVDSVVLALEYFTSYGSLEAQNIEVYELTQDIFKDSTYYSNDNFSLGATPIGTANGFVASPTDSVNLAEGTVPPQMRIRLDNSFGDYLLQDGVNANAYSNNDAFNAFMKGLHVRVNNVGQVAGEGAVFSMNLLSQNSKLTLYYHNDTANGLRFDYFINENAARINLFDHDYTGTAIADQFGQNGVSYEKVYVHSMGGVKTKIEFPTLETFFDSIGDVAINKAELVFPAFETPDDYPVHQTLTIVQLNSEGNSTFVSDLFEGINHFGGSNENGVYTINLTRYLQGLMADHKSGNLENLGVFIIDGGAANTANRTILNGSVSAANNMKFNISYTPL